MSKEKYPYQLSAGDKVEYLGKIQVVVGVKWVHNLLQYQIDVIGGDKIYIAKIKTVTVIN